MDIDAWIRGRRAEKDQPQEEAAEIVGVSARLWSQWERSVVAPKKIADIRALAAWAGVEPAEVLAMIPEPDDETEAA